MKNDADNEGIKYILKLIEYKKNEDIKDNKKFSKIYSYIISINET